MNTCVKSWKDSPQLCINNQLKLKVIRNRTLKTYFCTETKQKLQNFIENICVDEETRKQNVGQTCGGWKV